MLRSNYKSDYGTVKGDQSLAIHAVSMSITLDSTLPNKRGRIDPLVPKVIEGYLENVISRHVSGTN
jgi:hypothetical protein